MPDALSLCQTDVPLSPLTTLKIGGVAEYFFQPQNLVELADFIRHKPQGMDITLLGEGSNILIRDGGIAGVVISLKNLVEVVVTGETVTAQAGATSGKVARAAREAGLTGIEFLCGIPGSVGGALYMNAGAYGHQTADNLISVEVMTSEGELKTLTPEEVGFSYRKNNLPVGWLFVGATFKLQKGDKEAIRSRMREINKERATSQPLNMPSSGSWFKNLEDKKAWQITDEAGCRGMRVGQAQVSEKHSNFFVNLGGATAQDMEKLSEKVEQQIKEKLGITMHREVRIIGHE